MAIWTDAFDGMSLGKYAEPAYRQRGLEMRREMLIAMERDAYEQLGRRYEDLIRESVATSYRLLSKLVDDYSSLQDEINTAFRPMYREGS